MNPVIDLHAHSHYSDGTLSPAELVLRAQNKGVDVLALTDHDNTAGLAEAHKAAQQAGLTLINGVEVSVTWARRTVHIVGLGIDTENTALQQGLEGIREQRAIRANKMAVKLEKAGLSGVMASIKEYAGTEAATRTHFARYLVDNGHAKDMQTAFKRFLGKKGKAFVGGDWVSLEEAVGWIVNAGGQAVIAHPVRYKMTDTKLGVLIDEFKHAGGTGIEVSTATHMPHERRKMAIIAAQYELLSSAGSDFHSPGNPRIELGHNLGLPADTVPVWKDWEIEKKATKVVNGGLL